MPTMTDELELLGARERLAKVLRQLEDFQNRRDGDEQEYRSLLIEYDAAARLVMECRGKV